MITSTMSKSKTKGILVLIILYLSFSEDSSEIGPSINVIPFIGPISLIAVKLDTTLCHFDRFPNNSPSHI